MPRLVLSWPHFLHAEDKYKDAIQGLSCVSAESCLQYDAINNYSRPQEDEHGFWFDIQPVTGTTVSAKARIQINILVRKMGWTDLQDIEQDTVVPLLWFEEGIDELGMDIITVLKRAAVDPLTYRQYILYVFTFFICIEIILAFICLIRICQSVKMTEVIDQIQQIPGSAGNHSGHHDLEQADQPMLGADSTDTSRVTTATHSRNCSEGIKPPYIQGSSEAREKLIEDLSSRLSQKLTSQFQYNNIKDGSEPEPVVSHENLEALLPNQDQESRLPTSQEAVNLQSAAHNNKTMQLRQTQSAAVVRRHQVADNKESYEESLRGGVPELCVSESESESESGSEFEGPSVALVNVKPRLTSVSSSVTS